MFTYPFSWYNIVFLHQHPLLEYHTTFQVNFIFISSGTHMEYAWLLGWLAGFYISSRYTSIILVDWLVKFLMFWMVG
jgi:hypothetical protein